MLDFFFFKDSERPSLLYSGSTLIATFPKNRSPDYVQRLDQLTMLGFFPRSLPVYSLREVLSHSLIQLLQMGKEFIVIGLD